MKIYISEKSDDKIEAGKIVSDQKNTLLIGCGNGAIKVLQLQLAGKNKMLVSDFLKGYNVSGCFVK